MNLFWYPVPDRRVSGAAGAGCHGGVSPFQRVSRFLCQWEEGGIAPQVPFGQGAARFLLFDPAGWSLRTTLELAAAAEAAEANVAPAIAGRLIPLTGPSRNRQVQARCGSGRCPQTGLVSGPLRGLAGPPENRARSPAAAELKMLKRR